MKSIAFSLMILYLVIIVLWITNSASLFSIWGISIWILLIIIGFLTYKQLRDSRWLRKLLLFLSSFLILFLILTGLIHLTVTSMP